MEPFGIDKIKPSAAATISLCLCCFFCVEFMVFVLNRPLFLNYDYPIRVLIGFGITAPVFTCNAFLGSTMIYNSSTGSNKEEDEKEGYAAAALVTILVVSLLTLFCYSYSINLYQALWTLFWIELLIIFLAIVTRKKAKPVK